MGIVIIRIVFISVMLGLMIITLRACFKMGRDWTEGKKKNVFKKDGNYIINRSYKNNSDDTYNSYSLTMYCPRREDKLLNRNTGLFV